MPVIHFNQRGDFSRLQAYLKNCTKFKISEFLERFGKRGVEILSRYTPVDTGLTSSLWEYSIEEEAGKTILSWSNTNVNNGEVIALLIQYGHGTGTGGYIPPQDFVNPAMDELYKEIVDELAKEVKTL